MLRKARGQNSGNITPESRSELISELAQLDSNGTAISVLSDNSSHQIKEELIPKVRPPILVNHGLLSSSADWVLLGPQKALGKYLYLVALSLQTAN